jgi:hypothetical protein
VDGKPVDKYIGRVADDFDVPEREELDDVDESRWPRDATGIARDPWTKQSYLPMEDVETGEIAVFVTGSQGGRGAVSDLCNAAAKNFRNGLPHIRLGVSSYRHKVYGRIEVPHFPITGWTAAPAPKPIQEELNDSIPF